MSLDKSRVPKKSDSSIKIITKQMRTSMSDPLVAKTEWIEARSRRKFNNKWSKPDIRRSLKTRRNWNDNK